MINWIKSLFVLLSIPKRSKADLKKAAIFLSRTYGLNKNNFKFNSGSSFNILLDKDFKLNRKELLQDILKHSLFIYEGKGHSSLGRLKYNNNIIIYIKPKDKQGDLSPGKQNEKIFEKQIKKYLNKYEYLNLIFQSKTKEYKINNVSNIMDTSNKNNKIYNKADFTLTDNLNKKISNISIKQNDFIWESSITRYKFIYDKFIFNFINNNIENIKAIENIELPGKFFMINPYNNKPYSRIFIKGFPEYDDDNIIFGNEIPKPIIIEQNFNEQHFTNNLNNIIINVNHIYETVEEIEKENKLPVLSFSRNMSKPYGLDFKCIPENKTKYTYKANILEIPYEVLMNW